MHHSRCSRLFTIAILTVGLGTGVATAAELEEVLARFDEAQASLQTLSASFTETTSNRLLKKPITAEGRFYMTKPDSIRWEYELPEEMSFVIAADRYVGYFPAQKRAEQRNIRRYSERIFRFIGLGQGSVELSKFYRMRLEPNDVDDRYLLVLEPKKKRVRKRVEEVYFWLDASSYLPVQVEYRGKDGNSRRIDFREISVNPDLSASTYSVDIPADVDVTKGFSGLPGFSSQDYDEATTE